jgi:hypothetical protein
MPGVEQDLREGARRREVAPPESPVEEGDEVERPKLGRGRRDGGDLPLESLGEADADGGAGGGAGPAKGGGERRPRAPGVGGEEPLPPALEGGLSPEGEVAREEREPRERRQTPEEDADGGLQRAFASAPAAVTMGPSPRASR